jgi:hypothetical protein
VPDRPLNGRGGADDWTGPVPPLSQPCGIPFPLPVARPSGRRPGRSRDPGQARTDPGPGPGPPGCGPVRPRGAAGLSASGGEGRREGKGRPVKARTARSPERAPFRQADGDSREPQRETAGDGPGSRCRYHGGSKAQADTRSPRRRRTFPVPGRRLRPRTASMVPNTFSRTMQGEEWAAGTSLSSCMMKRARGPLSPAQALWPVLPGNRPRHSETGSPRAILPRLPSVPLACPLRKPAASSLALLRVASGLGASRQ